MPITILIGAQWGDEGKGRVVDWLAANADVVARYAGGDNAGHTVAVGDEVFKLHLIPSGILRDRAVSLLGNGMVINPVNLLKEIDNLRKMGISVTPERLIVSSRAHIISPAHIALDAAREKALGGQAIGTTLRGIGPAYDDKTARRGLRMGDMIDVEAFADALFHKIEESNQVLMRDGHAPINPQTSAEAYIDAASRLAPYIQDTSLYLNRRLSEGARIICEGAQGTLLDVDHGSYPFVTSSSPTVGGALTGLGIGPLLVDRVVGVAKAFSTRVGGGPMPTELEGELGDRLRGSGENFWDEFGTTTGRPRRCGWLDGVMLRYAAQVNGLSEIVLTKLDILSGFDEIKVAVAYEIDGVRQDFPPDSIAKLARAKAIYDTLPGWQEPLSAVRHAVDLPQSLLDYAAHIGALCGVPVKTISVGPERDQLVHLEME